IRVPPPALLPAGKPNNNPVQATTALPLYYGAFALPVLGEDFGVELGLQSPTLFLRHRLRVTEPMKWSDEPLDLRRIYAFQGLTNQGRDRIQFAPVFIDGSMRWALPNPLLGEQPGFRFGVTDEEEQQRILRLSLSNWDDNGRISEDTLRAL